MHFLGVSAQDMIHGLFPTNRAHLLVSTGSAKTGRAPNRHNALAARRVATVIAFSGNANVLATGYIQPEKQGFGALPPRPKKPGMGPEYSSFPLRCWVAAAASNTLLGPR